MINIFQCKHLIKHILLFKRFYGKKATTFTNMKRVHQEAMRYVDSHAQINILSDVNLQIKTINLHDYPDGNVFIAELHGGDVNNTTTTMTINISNDDKFVEVILKNRAPYSDFHCELVIPIKAALNIQTKRGANIENIYGNEIIILAKDFIRTKEIRSENVKLESRTGTITCHGLLLAQHTNIQTLENGNIMLEKVLGDKFTCKTINGNITVNCCYADKSKFETDSGSLILNNIHKHSEVLVHRQSQLYMTGVHGNLHVKSKGGSVNLQLSELNGENSIETENLQFATIHISDSIEQNIDVLARILDDKCFISLDESLTHLSNCLMEDKRSFNIARKNPQGQLRILCKYSSLTLAKSSWQDALRERMVMAKQMQTPPTTANN